jgi:hypothetical protein
MALDWAIWHDILMEAGARRGRKAEDGQIGSKYLLTETTGSNYPQRTEWNVRDSDESVIFSIAPEPTGGSKKTIGRLMGSRLDIGRLMGSRLDILFC